jgi:hypothetical protein
MHFATSAARRTRQSRADVHIDAWGEGILAEMMETGLHIVNDLARPHGCTIKLQFGLVPIRTNSFRHPDPQCGRAMHGSPIDLGES